jgi:hypothetical protein
MMVDRLSWYIVVGVPYESPMSESMARIHTTYVAASSNMTSSDSEDDLIVYLSLILR